MQPFPPSGAIYQAPKVLIDLHPVWSPDGRELMYIPALASAQLATVRVAARDGLTFGVPVTSPFWIIRDFFVHTAEGIRRPSGWQVRRLDRRVGAGRISDKWDF